MIALTDSAGALIQQYHYGPYGESNANNAGITNPFQYTGRENDGDGLYYYRARSGITNPFQYTGRENDGDGLYFYRARYYSPSLKRFISEDPIGFGDGQDNFYAYVGGNPISQIDPYGLWTFQFGLSGSFTIFGFSVTGYFEVAFDGHGNVAPYYAGGAGAGIGLGGSGGVQFAGSDADNICELTKTFWQCKRWRRRRD